MDGTAEHRLLVECLNAPTLGEFLSLYKQRKHVEVQESLQTMPKKLIIRLFDAVKGQVEIGVLQLHSGTPSEDEDAQAQAVQALQALAAIISLCIKNKQQAGLERLHAAAEQLHDTLLAAAAYPELQDAIARMCLAWWQAEAVNREAFILQTLPYYLVLAITAGKAVDVKRCNAMHAALDFLDFDDASIADMERLLLRAAMSPAFLRLQEGRRFLAYLFTLQAQLVRELGAIIRNQIPCGRKSVLEAYGQILCRAWREATGACKLEVENLIQGLMQAAIYASTEAMAASIRRVLGELHKHKGAPGIDELLLQLYQPILFRALAAANTAVRLNALQIFFDVFPLQEPHGALEEMDALLTRQFNLITTALGDTVPAVRAAAARGACSLLDQFWELIPATVGVPYLKRLTGALAYDAASPAVRAAVVEGLATLVPNPMAHAVLKLVLPQLSPLFSDRSLRVRVAMADLLLMVGTVRDLHFYDVVPIKALLEAMGSDQRAVSERIQRLLLPYHCVGTDEGPVRIIALLQSFPEAGRLFCQFLSRTWVKVSHPGDGGPLHMVLQLCTALQDHLHAHLAPTAPPPPKSGKGQGRKAKRKHTTALSQQADTNLQAAEGSQGWQAIFAGMAELAAGLAAGPSGNTSAVKRFFSEARLAPLIDMACGEANGRCAAAVVLGAAPASLSEGLCDRWLDTVLFGSVPTDDALRRLLESLCTGEALNYLISALQHAMDQQAVPQSVTALRCIPAMLGDASLRERLFESKEMMRLMTLSGIVDAWSGEVVDVLSCNAAPETSAAPLVTPDLSCAGTGNLHLAFSCAMKLGIHLCLKTQAMRNGQDEDRVPVGRTQMDTGARGLMDGALSAATRLVQTLTSITPPDHILRRVDAASNTEMCSLHAAVRDAVGALIVVLSTTADSAKVLDGATAMPDLANACGVATTLLHWLATHSEQGADGFCHEFGAAAVHAARLACNLASRATTASCDSEGGGDAGQEQSFPETASLATAVMVFGCSCSAEDPVLDRLSCYLPPLLTLLCRNQESGWLAELARCLPGPRDLPSNDESASDMGVADTAEQEKGVAADEDMHCNGAFNFFNELASAAARGKVVQSVRAYLSITLARAQASGDTLLADAAMRFDSLFESVER